MGSTLGVLAQLDAPTEIATPEIVWSALIPLLSVSVGAVLLILLSSLIKRFALPSVNTVLTIAFAAGGIIGVLPLWSRVQDETDGPFSAVGGAIGIDGFSLFLTTLICVAVILVALLSDEYLAREGIDGAEYHVLLLLSAAGGIIMAMANDLIVLFVGLEVLSIAAYVLAAMHRRRAASQEAGMKYFVLGAFSSAFLLYGIAFVYGATGSTNLVTIKDYLAANVLLESGTLLVGLALLLVGLGFKVAAVPFHAWAPDVYEGSPSPVVAFMASAVKAAGFAALLRVFVVTFDAYVTDWQPIVYALAVLSLLVGAVLGVVQTNVKRMMAYSSINHAGFMLVGVQVATDDGISATLFYLAAYTLMVIGAFAVITVIGGDGDGNHDLEAYRGLAARRPVLSLVFVLFLLAQAGVPLTAGFFAKFQVIAAAVEGRSFWLAIVAMVSAVISAFIYLRIAVTMYAEGEDGDEVAAGPDTETALIPGGAQLTLALTALGVLVVGILPWIVQEWAADAIPVLVAAAG